MSLDAFFVRHLDELDSSLGVVTMTYGNQSFSVVMDMIDSAQEGDMGGMEGDIKATVTAQTSDVASPNSILHKRVTVDGTQYRVARVAVGSVSIRFDLADVNAS
jgi:hypothetical protein